LGEGCKAKITPAVVQAVVVDVVNDEMVGGVGDLAVHFYAFAVFFSNGVVIFISAFHKPGILAQDGVVFGIDDGEFPLGQRYEAGGAVLGFGGP